jgi:MFS family permease
MGSSVNIALPAIGAEFDADAIVLGWIPTAYLLAAAMVAIPFGRISDIYGMKRIFSYGVILFTVASLLSALAHSAYSLIVFRVLQGIAGGMIFVTDLAIITSVYPPHERGKAIGINIATVYIALSIGNVRITPVQYPVLLDSIHTVFIICTVLCFLGIFVSLARGNGRG